MPRKTLVNMQKRLPTARCWQSSEQPKAQTFTNTATANQGPEPSTGKSYHSKKASVKEGKEYDNQAASSAYHDSLVEITNRPNHFNDTTLHDEELLRTLNRNDEELLRTYVYQRKDRDRFVESDEDNEVGESAYNAHDNSKDIWASLKYDGIVDDETRAFFADESAYDDQIGIWADGTAEGTANVDDDWFWGDTKPGRSK